jgi:hypothetical protein
MKMICECGKEAECPMPYEIGSTMEFAFSHGHEPALLITFRCACGAERITGPGVRGSALNEGLKHGKWMAEHYSCHSVSVITN